jgi:tetratricopeptide (TPR) repeat protein
MDRASAGQIHYAQGRQRHGEIRVIIIRVIIIRVNIMKSFYWILLVLLAVAVAGAVADSSAAAQESAVPSPAVRPSAGRSSAGKVDLVEIPQPELAGVDQPVQEQVRAAQAALAATLSRSTSSASSSRAEKANAFGSMGEIYQAYSFDEAALACYENASRLAPQSFRWFYYAGYLHQLSGDIDSALREYQRAVTLQPGNGATMLRLGNLELTANHLDSARAWFAKALAQRKSPAAAALMGLGKVALIEQKYPEALKYFQDALAREPKATSIHYQLAMTYRGLGDLHQMQEHMQARGDGEPTIEDPLLDDIRVLKQGKVGLLERGSAAIHEKRFADAIASYRQMIGLYPSDPIAHMYLGVALAKAGKSSEALEQYARAEQLAPGNAPIQYNMGILLIDIGKEEEATAHFREAIRLDPGLAASHFQLANLLMRNKKDEEAGREYGIAATLEPQNGFARLMQAMAAVHGGEYEQARSLLENASLALPRDPDIANALARLLAAAPDPGLRDERRALQIIESLVRSEQGDGFEEGVTLAMALASAGQFQEAVETQRAIIHELEASRKFNLARLLRQNLDLYEHQKPCRKPWASDDPVFTPVPSKLEMPVELTTMTAHP